jgi:hypothetical protein
MWTRIVGTFLLALIPMAAPAADSEEPYRGEGRVFYGPGRAPGGGTLQQIGVGGDGFLYKGFGAGADIGYQFPSEGFTYGIGLLSVNGSYHLNRSRHAKLSPFVTGGYTLAFRAGHANLANFGGGVTWWLAGHAGIRLEIRDYVWPGGQHSPQALVGLSFR